MKNKKTMNESGYSINVQVNGELETRFCYRIDARAEMAIDPETGESSECYMEFKLNHEKEIPFENYQKLHKTSLKHDLAGQMGICSDWLYPVTAEEHDRETDTVLADVELEQDYEGEDDFYPEDEEEW